MSYLDISFTTGQKVKFNPAQSDSQEVFEIVSWNDSENMGRIEDSTGQGWTVHGNQIVIVKDVSEFDEDEDEPEDYESLEEDEE